MYTHNDDAQPIVLTLGQAKGLVIQQHYTRNFWGRRVLAGIDKKLAISLIDPPQVYAVLAGSPVAHLMRPEVLDEGADRVGWTSRGPSYRWRWKWRSLCGAFEARVGTPAFAVVPQPSVTLTDTIWPHHRLCQRCQRCAALGRRAKAAG